MTLYELHKKYFTRLDYLDLELIIAHELKKSREFVLAHPDLTINKKQDAGIRKMLRRRIQGEPLAYILGSKEFFGLNFKVNRHTLIPRPETELLVEKILRLQPKNKSIIDVGTGSGNIIISLAKNILEKNKFYAIDISAKALAIAKQNAKLHKLEKKIEFLNGNLLDPLLKKSNLRDAVIVANLPYLSKKIYNATNKTVQDFESMSALYSAKNGLDHYSRLLKQVSDYNLKAPLFFEISPEQKPKIAALIKSFFPIARTEFYRDLAKKWRFCGIFT